MPIILPEGAHSVWPDQNIHRSQILLFRYFYHIHQRRWSSILSQGWLIPNNALVIERRFWRPSGAFREQGARPDGLFFSSSECSTEAVCTVLTAYGTSIPGWSFDEKARQEQEGIISPPPTCRSASELTVIGQLFSQTTGTSKSPGNTQLCDTPLSRDSPQKAATLASYHRLPTAQQ